LPGEYGPDEPPDGVSAGVDVEAKLVAVSTRAQSPDESHSKTPLLASAAAVDASSETNDEGRLSGDADSEAATKF
jgi:hypothetical protein